MSGNRGGEGPDRPGQGSGPRGLALVSVLWVLALLALIAASLTQTTRTEINLTRNLVENATAEALADAGVHRAILGLLLPSEAAYWRGDGTVYAWRFGSGEVRISIQDEGGKIDLNRAAVELVARLFVAVGLDAQESAVLADRIADFRDPDDLRRLNGAEDRDYADNDLSYGAKDALFEAVEELQQVLGMTRALYDRVAPVLTVRSGLRRPRQTSAPPLVRAALAGEIGQGLGPDLTEPSAEPIDLAQLAEVFGDAAPLRRSPVRLVTVHAEGRTQGGAVYAREAVVQLVGSRQHSHLSFSWKQGRRRLFRAKPADDTAE